MRVVYAALATVLLTAPAASAFYGEFPLEIVEGLRDKLLKHAYRTSYAIGDFNADGYGDLAIGIPYATVDGKRAAGKVIVRYGHPAGGTATVSTYDQAASGRFKLPGANESGDLVGFSLAAGDFNGDAITDLAVGAPGEDHTVTDAGAVFVGHGVSESGLDFRLPGHAYVQNESGRFDLPGETGLYHMVGFSLAAGSFDGDSYADLAIGVPGRWALSVSGDKATRQGVGAVVVAEGAAGGLNGQSPRHSLYQDEFWQDGDGTCDLPGNAEDGDLVGFSLAVGDFDGDGFDDLAIGAPGEDIAINGHTYRRAGAVSVLGGTDLGLDASPYAEAFHASGNGRFDLRGSVQAGALLGFALASGDFNGDGRADLAIGVPGRTVDGKPRAGAVVVARGEGADFGGPGLSGNWYRAELTQTSSDSRYDLPATAQEDAIVGYALAAGDFDYNPDYPRDDLAIGIPGFSPLVPDAGTPLGIRAAGHAGAVAVRFGSGTGGLASAKNPMLFQQSGPAGWDLRGTAEHSDQLGMGLAAGWLNTDLAADLVMSAPGERVTNLTMGAALTGGWDDMFVDGYTHVVNGASGTGPDTATQVTHWYARFRRGAQSDPSLLSGTGSLMNELAMMTGARLSGDRFFAGWFWTDLKLDPSREVDYLAGRAGMRDRALDGDRPARALMWFSVLDGSVYAQMRMTWEGEPESAVTEGTWFPRDRDLFDTPQKLILLPNLALEVIIEP